MVKLVGKGKLESDINEKDYIMFHKAEVSKVMDDSDLYNRGAEISDKSGTFLAGMAFTAYSLPGINNWLTYALVTILFLVGIALTIFGVCLKSQRKEKIDNLLNQKLEEAHN